MEQSTDTDLNTGNLNTGIHYNTGKNAYDKAFYLLNTGNWNTGIFLEDFYIDSGFIFQYKTGEIGLMMSRTKLSK